MTRKEMLPILLRQAQNNGFDFRSWYQARFSSDWTGAETAIAFLSEDLRYYALLFSHEFAKAFWKTGAKMQFVIPSATYSRVNGKGEVVTIHRKAFSRRTIKADVWMYHLREMATCDDPLRYLKRFLPPIEEVPAAADNTLSMPVAG